MKNNKKFVCLYIVLFFILMLPASACARLQVNCVEDFEEKYTTKNWWVFGGAEIETRANSKELYKELGEYSLGVKSVVSDWYGGGFGRNLPPSVNYEEVRYFCIDVWGQGTKGGIIAIKLVDDDNDNNVAEDDIDKSLLYDDEWTYKRIINWKGWKRLKIDLGRFEDSNAEIGDNKWNPEKTGRSQGLLKINIICLSKNQNDQIKFKIDNIGFCR
jgi:hypothetical protein